MFRDDDECGPAVKEELGKCEQIASISGHVNLTTIKKRGSVRFSNKKLATSTFSGYW